MESDGGSAPTVGLSAAAAAAEAGATSSDSMDVDGGAAALAAGAFLAPAAGDGSDAAIATPEAAAEAGAAGSDSMDMDSGAGGGADWIQPKKPIAEWEVGDVTKFLDTCFGLPNQLCAGTDALDGSYLAHLAAGPWPLAKLVAWPDSIGDPKLSAKVDFMLNLVTIRIESDRPKPNPRTSAAAAAGGGQLSPIFGAPRSPAGASSPDSPLCPEHLEDQFSHQRVDKVLSGLDQRISLIKDIYREMAYSPKESYMEGDVRFAMRGMKFGTRHGGFEGVRMEQVENIAVGDCQSGKSLEAVWIAWCSFFILGCVPVITVRNRGGLVQGAQDMEKFVHTLNGRIESIVRKLAPKHGIIEIDEMVENFALQPKRSWDGVVEKTKSTMKPTVLIVLNNAPQMRKMLESHSSYGNRKFFTCKLVEDLGNDKWKVQYDDGGDTEERTVQQLRGFKRADRRPGAPGKAEKSKELRYQDAFLTQIERHYGKKDGRVRVVFVVDEADISVGNPDRKGNKLAHYHFQFHETNDERNARDTRRGVREYIFGSVSITATPVALYLCTFAKDSSTISFDGEDGPQTYNICPAQENGDGFYAAIAYLVGDHEPGEFLVDEPKEWRDAAEFRRRVFEFMQKYEAEIVAAGRQWTDECRRQGEHSADPENDGKLRLGISPNDVAITAAAAILGRPIRVHFELMPDDQSDSEDDNSQDSDDLTSSVKPRQVPLEMLSTLYKPWSFGKAAAGPLGEELHVLKHKVDVDPDKFEETPSFDARGKTVEASRHSLEHYNALEETDSANSTEPATIQRRATPHVTFLDIPDNYVAYPGNPRANGDAVIERVIVDPRVAKTTPKIELYKRLWTDQLDEELIHCTKETWLEWVQDVERNGTRDIGQGFLMCRNPHSSGVQVRRPRPNARSPTATSIIQMIEAMETSTRDMNAADGSQPDLDNIKVMIASMMSTDDPYRHALVITDKTKLTRQQKELQTTLVATHEAQPLTVVTYNCVDGTQVAFTKHLREKYLAIKPGSGDLGLLEHAQDMVRQIAPGADTEITAGARLQIKKQPINVMYQALKQMGCTHNIVITGAIGGRGVSYHDKDHERILTDMYACVDIPETRQVTADGQATIQNLGRLNTIFARDKFPGGQCPPIRLWAPEAVHEVHKIYLNTVFSDSLSVKENKGDLEAALKNGSLYKTGETHAGKPNHLRSSGPKFQTHERDARGGVKDVSRELGPRQKKQKMPSLAQLRAGNAAAGGGGAAAEAAPPQATTIDLSGNDDDGGANDGQWKDNMDHGCEGTWQPPAGAAAAAASSTRGSRVRRRDDSPTVREI